MRCRPQPGYEIAFADGRRQRESQGVAAQKRPLREAALQQHYSQCGKSRGASCSPVLSAT